MAHLACSAPQAPTRLTIQVDGAAAATLTIEAVATSFRLGVRFNGRDNAALSSPMITPVNPPQASKVSWGGMEGLSTIYGALLASPSGMWALYDAANQTVLSSNGPPALMNASSASDGGISLPVTDPTGTAASGPSQPCLGNGMFGPPFYHNRNSNYLSFAVSEWDFDPQHPHCYPVAFDGTAGVSSSSSSSSSTRDDAVTADVDVTVRDLCNSSMIHAGTDVQGSVRSSKYPNGLSGATTETCCAACNSASDCVAWIFADSSHPDPSGQNCWPLASFTGTQSRDGRTFGGPLPPSFKGSWWAMGSAADWYLSPVSSSSDFTEALYKLTGPVAVPPMYALGFQACYWGYDSVQDVQSNITAFREGNFPIDSVIEDYDWWLNTSDKANSPDFGYAPTYWCIDPTCSFPAKNGSMVDITTAAELLSYWKSELNMRWGGIRKPRAYSDQALSQKNGWLLPPNFAVGAGGNNWNYTIEAFQEWYISNSIHFIKDGVAYWWNDEGETQWFTYSLWNQAEAKEFQAVYPKRRYYSLNRSFQPGMQSLAATTWTGDRQDCSHATTLGFIANGQPFVACDMTAPSASILVRQYQNAVFLPVMRVHAMHGTPRFPYLWGEEAADAMRDALNMRYAFLPTLYSLFHRAHSSWSVVAQPASWVYDEKDYPRSLGDVTYMVGDTILPSDVCTSNGPSSAENTTVTHFPPGTWFDFNTTTTVTGNQTVTKTNVPLAHLPLYIRAGALIALNSETVQFTDALGGHLTMHVYAGVDAVFALVEDDHESMAYTDPNSAGVRKTDFKWSDVTKTLSWSAPTGGFDGPNVYTDVQVMLFASGASSVPTQAGKLGTAGSVAF